MIKVTSEPSEMNEVELTDIIYNSLNLDNREWDMEFDDYDPQVIHLTHESGAEFKLKISGE